MSAVPPAPPENRATPAAIRVHRMRIARGACWVIVAALLGVAVLTLLDAAVRLPGWVRGPGLAVWLTGTGLVAWRLVVRRLPPDSIGEPTPHPREELPGNLNAAAAAAISLAAALVFATLVPGAGEHLRRVVLPWSRPAAAPYRVTVTSGEPVVRRGDPVTLSAYTDKIDPSATAPHTATLFGRERNGKEWKLPMVGNGSGAFHATRASVAADFDYRVQIGTATSDWFVVSALDPAEPAAESAIEVHPPKYAPLSATRLFPGFVSFAGFQHGTAEIRLQFTRPATTAFLEWRPEDGGPVELTTLDLHSGNTTFRLRQDGSLKLVTVVERNGKALRTEIPVRVRVAPDGPPRFERVAGVSSRTRTARPDSVLPIELTATDDIAVGSAVLEYALASDHSTTMALPIPLSGAGTARAEGRLDFDLSGKGRAGDTIRFRVRVADTRRLGDPDLKPQESRYPETGWSVIRLDPAAPPLDEQDYLAQRDSIRDAAHSALDEINEARKDASSLRRDTVEESALAPDHTVRLNEISDRVRRAASLLQDAARDAPNARPAAARRRAPRRRGRAREKRRRYAAQGRDRQPDRSRAAFTAAINSLNDVAFASTSSSSTTTASPRPDSTASRSGCWPRTRPLANLAKPTAAPLTGTRPPAARTARPVTGVGRRVRAIARRGGRREAEGFPSARCGRGGTRGNAARSRRRSEASQRRCPPRGAHGHREGPGRSGRAGCGTPGEDRDGRAAGGHRPAEAQSVRPRREPDRRRQDSGRADRTPGTGSGSRRDGRRVREVGSGSRGPQGRSAATCTLAGRPAYAIPHRDLRQRRDIRRAPAATKRHSAEESALSRRLAG